MRNDAADIRFRSRAEKHVSPVKRFADLGNSTSHVKLWTFGRSQGNPLLQLVDDECGVADVILLGQLQLRK